MSVNENTPPQPTAERRRRSSIVEIFINRPSNDSTSANGSSSKPAGSSMASAMAQQSRARRMSITSLGLSGSPTHGQPTSPFGTLKDRGQSMTDGTKRPSEVDDSAVDDDVDAASPVGSNSRPNSPTVARRVSFGAKRKDRSSSGTWPNGSTGGDPGMINSKGSSPPNSRKDGFNWSENLRNRAERTSISTGAGIASGLIPMTSAHGRSQSLVSSNAMPSSATTQQVPAAPKQPVAPRPPPDHFQERILKGDFYMD